ncbi:MAG: hypothetical protein U9R19_01935 [Bacteroidota bacterium]|nr:hypothetical protein [Bacteroidota bacterium]
MKINLRFFILVFILPVSAGLLFSQEKDSLFNKEYSKVFTDSLKKKNHNWERNYIDFRKKLKENASKTKFTKELYNLVFINSGSNTDTLTTNKLLGTDPFLKHKGKIIDEILIFKLDPFGPSVVDFVKQPTSFLAKFANKIQIDTRDFVIRNSLLFREGEKLVPENIADTERLLRKLNYIRDVKIVVADQGKNKVALLVISKDNWSIVAGFSHYNNDSNSVRLYDRNILGLGHMLKNEILLRKNELGYIGLYKIENIGGSFISGSAGYTNAFGYKDYIINFDRSLVSQKLTYGGGIKLQQKHTFIVIPEKEGVPLYNIPLSYNYQDIWMGRRICILPPSKKCPENVDLFWVLQYKNQQFLERPTVTADSNFIYQNNQLLLTGLSFAKRKYYKAKLINYFGISEDIPTGYKLDILMGFEKREFYNRWYTGIRFLKSNYFGPGYYSAKIEYGSFFRNNTSDQGVIALTLSGFGNGSKLGSFRYRPFFRINYSMGIHRLGNELINLNGYNGITSLKGETNGLQRIVFKHESVLFSMKNFADFQYAFTAFADFGLIGYADHGFEQSDFYAGLGIGLRINNHNLFFRSIKMSLAYFPVLPENGNSYRTIIGSSPKFRIEDFIMEKPELMEFK